MKKSMVLVMFGLLVFGGSAAEAKFRALLVGIDYENANPHIPRLYGAINDAQAMYGLMTEKLGIPADSIHMLLESQATRTAILQNFRKWLIEETSAGDVVFFQYAGHGASVPDPTGRQKDDPVKQGDAKGQALAEAFVPFDTEMDAARKSVKNLIFDAEVQLLLNELQGRKVYLFLDCCYSGGVTRDFPPAKFIARFLRLPWKTEETRVMLPPDFPPAFPAAVLRGLKTTLQQDPAWHPEYVFFAAAKYSQLARDGEGNGAFTLPVLRLLQANPQAKYTNRDVLAYARQYIQRDLGVAASDQEPVFYGPAGALDDIFVLLTQRPAAPVVTPPPAATPAPTPEIGKTTVFLTGQAGQLQTQLAAAIAQCDYLHRTDGRADVTVEVTAANAQLYNAFGKPLQTIALGAEAAANVLQALEGFHIVRQLAALENPAAPFAVDVWLDEPGQTQFPAGAKVTLYYRVNGLPQGQKAYLTLLNVAPDGTLALLYPQKADFYSGAGAKFFLNAEIVTGKVYSIPKTQKDLPPGQNVAVDARLKLTQAGEEYFKAIVTSEPVDWDSLNIGEFRARFQGAQARSVIIEAVAEVSAAPAWATGALRVEVQGK